MAPAAAASRSFVLSAMLLSHRGSLVCWLWRCAEALQLLQLSLSVRSYAARSTGH